MELSYYDVIKFVEDVVKYEVPRHKFCPCKKCKLCDGTNTENCKKYQEWKKLIEVNPIMGYEQKAIDFINKLKAICEY